jgi:hypothetical protein
MNHPGISPQWASPWRRQRELEWIEPGEARLLHRPHGQTGTSMRNHTCLWRPAILLPRPEFGSAAGVSLGGRRNTHDPRDCVAISDGFWMERRKESPR